jgi:ferritin-like metal-binding protein YciE
MERVSLRGFYISELKKCHDAETQLAKALETIVQDSSSTELRAQLEKDLEQTRDHATRIQMILEVMGEKPQGARCAGMQSLIQEMQELSHQGLSGEVLDSALIAYAQRIEHYEIALYGTLRDYATALGDRDTASQLQTILEEEKEADRWLTKTGQTINAELARKETSEQNQPRLAVENESGSRIKPAA